MLNAILSRWARARWSAEKRTQWLDTTVEASERDSRGSDSSLLQSLLRWIPVDSENAAKSRQPGVQRANIPALRAAFEAALAGIDGEAVIELRRSIQRCRSARDLWHLRTWLYTEVARAHSQWEAERRLADLATLLPRQFSGLVFSKHGREPRH